MLGAHNKKPALAPVFFLLELTSPNHSPKKFTS